MNISNITLVLEALEKISLTLEERKCHFCYDNIELLGHASISPRKLRRLKRMSLCRSRNNKDIALDTEIPKEWRDNWYLGRGI